MPNVERGDVCIVSDTQKSIEIKGTAETMRGTHTFMITQPQELNDATPTAHLTWGGLEFRQFSYQFGPSEKVTIFRCAIGGRGEKACDHAKSWTNTSLQKKGHYSHERAKAVMHDLPCLGDLPYEFDALRRSIKWARKHDKEFSTNKGLTCAAYIVACYQAAAFLSFGYDKLQTAWDKIEQLRLDKKEFRKQLGNVSNPSYREFANPGAKIGQETDAITEVLACLGLQTKDPRASLQQLLSGAMYTDGRFIHTDGLSRRLRSANSGWIKVHKHVPAPQVITQNPAVVAQTPARVGGSNPLYTGGGNRTAASSGDDPFADVTLDTW